MEMESSPIKLLPKLPAFAGGMRGIKRQGHQSALEALAAGFIT